jgi:hypothetical protein
MKAQAKHGLARGTALALAGGIMLLAAGCGSSSTPSAAATPAASSAAATPQAISAACKDVAALRTSLTNLTKITVGKDMGSQLAAKVNDVKANLDALKTHAHGEWSTQVDALKSSLTTLENAAKGLSDGSTSVSDVVTAVGGVTSATTNLLAATNKRCPSSS